MSTTSGDANGEWDVKKVAATVLGHIEGGSDSPVPFFHILELLKTTKREGWRRFGIQEGESISDHMYRMAVMTMFPPESLKDKLDIPRCTQMALVHDMAEALVGDITPVDGVAKPEKNRREATTMDFFLQTILRSVNCGGPGANMRGVWQEYEDDKTLEAHYVHDIDKIELLLQMVEYERTKKDEMLDLGEFSYVAQKVVLPEMQEWAAQIIAEREALWQGKKHLALHKTLPGKAELAQKEEYYGNGSAPETK